MRYLAYSTKVVKIRSALLLTVLLVLVAICSYILHQNFNYTYIVYGSTEYYNGSILYNTYYNGSVLVTIILRLHEKLKITLPLEGEVKPESIIVLDEHGLPLPYDHNKTSIIIYSLNSTRITLIYMTEELVSYSNGIWILHIKPFLPPVVILPENSILLKYDGNPQIRAEDGRIILHYSSCGEYRVYFTLAIPVKEVIGKVEGTTQTIPVTNLTLTPTRTPTNTITPAKLKLEEAYPLDNLLKIMVIPAITVLLVIIILYLRKRRLSSLTISKSILDERDREIIDMVKTKGAISLSELTKLLNVPKSTIWRRVRKLQKLGYIEVERVSGKLIVKVKKEKK